MNPISLLSALSFSFGIFLMYESLRLRSERRHLLFTLSTIVFSFWSLSKVYFYSTPSISTAQYLHLINAMLSIVMTSLLFHYFILLSPFQKILRNPISWILIYAPSLINIIIMAHFFESLFSLSPSDLGWVARSTPGNPWSLISLITTSMMSLASIAVIFLWYRKTPKGYLRKLPLILLQFTVLPLIFSVLLISLFQFMALGPVPEMTHFFAVIWLAGIWFTLKKYQFIRFHSDIILEQILHSSSDLMIIHDHTGTLIHYNQKAAQSLKIKSSDLMTQSLLNWIQDRKDKKDRIIALLRKNISFNLDITIDKDDSTVIPVYWLSTPFKVNRSGEVLFLSILHDKREINSLIYHSTSRLNNQLTQRLSGIQYRSTLDAISDLLVVSDSYHNIVLYNQAMAKYADNLSKEDLLGRSLFGSIDIIPLTSRKLYEKILKQKEKTVIQEEHQIEGQTVFYEVQRIPIIEDDKVQYIVTLFHDLEKKLKAEELQIRNEKMESLAILTGGITHEFNNILTGIMGNLSIANYKSNQPEVKKILKRAEQASYRAKNLTSHLMTFSRKDSPDKKTASLTQSLVENARFLLSGSKIKVKTDFHHKSDKVNYDQGQMQRVFHNLLINAKDAMPEGGILLLSSGNLNLESGQNGLDLKPGPYLVIKIEDGGQGISPEVMNHIFDPFYTTKESGTGLGLSTTFSIIKNHEGCIDVSSEPGNGSCFTIYLPLSEARPEDIVEPDEQTLHGLGHILVMDDEDIILQTTKEILTYLGYRVSICKNGDQALDMYKKSLETGDRFDVVFLDMIIPGGRGAYEIIDELLQLDPQAKAVISSGYAHTDMTDDFKEKGFKAQCTKPYDVTLISRCVKNVLSEKF